MVAPAKRAGQGGSREARSGRFNFRTTPRQDALIRAAAELRGVSASLYVAESATARAEADLADRRRFMLSREQFEAFQAVLDRPPQEKPRLRRLFAERTMLERD